MADAPGPYCACASRFHWTTTFGVCAEMRPAGACKPMDTTVTTAAIFAVLFMMAS